MAHGSNPTHLLFRDSAQAKNSLDIFRGARLAQSKEHVILDLGGRESELHVGCRDELNK